MIKKTGLKEKVNNISEERVNASFFVFFTVVACIFAYIINKNVELSPPVLITVGGFALMGLVLVSFSKPEVSLYALTAYMPFSKLLVGDFGGFATAFNLTNILFIIILGGHLARSSFRQEKVPSNNALNWWIALFCAFATVSLLRGTYFFGERYAAAYIVELKRWLTPVMLYFLTLFVVRDKKIIKNVIVIICIVTTIVGLLAIKEYIDVGEHSSMEDMRIGAIAEQPNQLGAFFTYYTFLIMAFLFMNWKKFRYWLLLIPFFICFRGVQVTFSRGAYLAFATGLFGLCFFKSKRLFTLAVIVALFSVFNPVLVPKGIQQRFGSLFVKDTSYIESVDDLESSVESSAQSRIIIWRGALRMIQDYPLLGVGYGMFPKAIPYYCPIGHNMDAHNMYLLMTAEMGIPTLIVFLIVVLMIFLNTRWVYKNSKDEFIKTAALGFLAGLSGFMTANVFGSRMISQEIISYFWMLAALMVRAKIMEQTGGATYVRRKKKFTKDPDKVYFGKKGIRFVREGNLIIRKRD